MGDKYIPDAGEPHLHIHKGGVTYTSTTHSHKNLQKGDMVYTNVCNDLIADLNLEGSARSVTMSTWITNNLV
jgi:hypothetical protein